MAARLQPAIVEVGDDDGVAFRRLFDQARRADRRKAIRLSGGFHMAAAAMAEPLDHIVADLALAERPEAPVDLAEILSL